MITRAVCITEFHPAIRFFAQAKGSASSRLRVEVLYEDLGGSVNAMPVAYLRPSLTWQPTVIVPIYVNLRAAVAQSKTAAVAFRLSAEEGDGTWLVDGLYVDPVQGEISRGLGLAAPTPRAQLARGDPVKAGAPRARRPSPA